MSSQTLRRVALAFGLGLAVALVGVLIAGRDSSPNPASSDTQEGIFSEGHTWVVRVTRDTDDVAPEGSENSTYTDVYRFEVQSKEADGTWRVFAKQDGAVGPWADGYTMFYTERDGKMVLSRASLGGANAVPAKLAQATLGVSFPLEMTYSKRPTDTTLDGRDIDGSTDATPPPSNVPPPVTGSNPPPGSP